MKSFRDLDVYQKAFGIALEVHRISLGFPKNEQYALADQMRRGSKSVCANIAEGFGKKNHSQPEFKRFLNTALGSANEMLVWVDFCLSLSYIDEVTSRRWQDTYDHICRMLNRLCDTIGMDTRKSSEVP